MKTKLLALLLVIVTVLSMLASCGGTGGTGTGGTDEGGDGEDTGDTTPTAALEFSCIIYDDYLPANVDWRAILNAYQVATGKRLSTARDVDVDETEGEIVIGNTNRSITKKAQRQLERQLRLKGERDWDDIAYFIYVKDGSVALVWDDDYAADKAIQKLKEYVLSIDSDEPVLVNGYKELVNWRYTADKEAREAEQRAASIEKVKQTFGADVADAVAAHMSLFDDRFYMWIADLYEPRTCICDNYDENGYRVCLLPKDEDGNYICHGGGFYYSNSGRDNAGYDIDIESTVQAINFLSSSGMLAEYGGSTAKALPQQMKNDVVAFAKSLQDPVDGYFYHPQWGKAVGTSRIGRDLGWATQIINTFGGQPLYNTPNGYKGSLGAPGAKAALTPELGESAAVAASKVQLAATAWPKQLQTLADFDTYMKSFNLAENSYSTGNTFASQTGQINSRDKEGLESGEFKDEDGDGVADNGFAKAFETYFNSKQNPENGLWQDSVHYNSVNGLMKISSAYNSLKIKLPYADKAFASAAEMALLDPETADVKGKKATGSVDVYNPWVAMSAVLSNINKYGEKAEATALRTALQEKAADMVRVTTAKTKKFQKEDGSYGYTWTSSPANSQGAPVAVPGTIEGDINGGCIALRGVWGNMSSVLQISVPLYYPSDFDKFINRINELEPVIKHNGNVEIESGPIDFEDESVGSNVADRMSISTDQGGIEVIKDPKNSSNLALKLYNKPSTVTGSALVAVPVNEKDGNCYVLEWDMYVNSAKNAGTAFQIKIGDSYMFTLGFTDGKVSFGDSSSTGTGVKNSFPGKVNFQEWHKVRLEFYPAGDGADKTPVTKIFVDGTLIAISDNYFGKENNKAIATAYNSARFYALQSTELEVYFDNITAGKIKQEYKAGTIGSIGDGSDPVTPPAGGEGGGTTEKKEGFYDFEVSGTGNVTVEGVELNPNTKEEGNTMTVIADPKKAANKVLAMQTKKSSVAGNTIRFTAANAANANCYVAEFDIEVDATYSTKDFIAQFYFTNGKSTNISTLNLNFKYKEGAYVISSIQARHNKNGASSGDIVTDVAAGERLKLRFEYYTENGMCKVYINDKYVGEQINYWNADNSKLGYTCARFYTTYATENLIYIDNFTAEGVVKAYAAGDPTAKAE